MSKTLIDVDDDLLSRATEVLGTATKKETVNRALQEVVDRAERARGLEWLYGSDSLQDLADPGVRERARR
jgi:Arc/MetJ family transcription regulator